jgi:hypothetical protein
LTLLTVTASSQAVVVSPSKQRVLIIAAQVQIRAKQTQSASTTMVRTNASAMPDTNKAPGHHQARPVLILTNVPVAINVVPIQLVKIQPVLTVVNVGLVMLKTRGLQPSKPAKITTNVKLAQTVAKLTHFASTLLVATSVSANLATKKAPGPVAQRHVSTSMNAPAAAATCVGTIRIVSTLSAPTTVSVKRATNRRLGDQASRHVPTLRNAKTTH